MTVTQEQELAALREIGRVVAVVLHEMLEAAQPGMTTAELDAFGAARLESFGAKSAPQVTYGFPGATCISVNEVMAHGIPDGRPLEEGDILNVDVSAELGGFFGDNAGTRVVGTPTPAQTHLIETARTARDRAIASLRPGCFVNQIGRVFEHHAREGGYHVVRNLCSHGIGRSLHEDPQEILGYFDRRDRRKLGRGAVVTVEPFLSTGSPWATDGDDGWALMNESGGRSAQFEHTIYLGPEGPEILTLVR